MKFNPDSDQLGDLIAKVPQPTPDQIAVGVLALDDYYDGKKDPDLEGAVAHVYRVMKALEN